MGVTWSDLLLGVVWRKVLMAAKTAERPAWRKLKWLKCEMTKCWTKSLAWDGQKRTDFKRFKSIRPNN